MTLEEILEKWFHCKNPFIISPRPIDNEGHKEYFTKGGAKAYGQLTELLYAIGAITETENVMDSVVETLDDIVRDEF